MMWILCLATLWMAVLSALTPHGIEHLWTDEDDRPLLRDWLGSKLMAMYASHPECGMRLIEWPEMLLPGDLTCRRCGRDLDPSDEVCDASIASGKPHHMHCPS